MEIEKELAAEFHGLRVIELEIDGLSIRRENSDLVAFKAEVQERIRQNVRTLEEVKNKPVPRAYRDFYWRVGIDPTKTRPAGEALLRRIVAGRDLPKVITFVDAYNLASAETCIAIAALDLMKVNNNSLLMRRARAGEPFLGIGMDSQITLKGIEVVIEDTSSKEIIALYPYRDSDSSKVTETTRSVLMMMCGVPRIEETDLRKAYELARDYVTKFCVPKRGSAAEGDP